MSEQAQEPSATPAAEAKAEELGVDLDQVEPSGSSGDILVKDVEAAAEGGGDAPQTTTQGDLVPGADEHPVDHTPPPSPDAPQPSGGPQGDAHEPMNKMDMRGDANVRGVGGGDDTVAH